MGCPAENQKKFVSEYRNNLETFDNFHTDH